MITDDAELLGRYVSERSQDAFAEFVRRNLPFVFSAAVRRLNGDVHRASDVSQIVFAAVAREAPKLSEHPSLVGWLYTATRHAVIDLVRAEKRRRAREEVHAMQELSTSSDSLMDWQKLSPVIDDALDHLPARDREVILLRFFQAHSYLKIGDRLGLSDEAARKRVERALEGLRRLLIRRGISSTAAALSTILGSETIVAASPGLATTIVGSACTGSFSIASTAFMTVTKLHGGIIAAVVLGGAVGLVSHDQTIAPSRRAQGEKLTPDNISLTEQEAGTRANATRQGAQPSPLVEPGDLHRSITASNPPLGPPGLALPRAKSAARDPEQLTQLHRRYDSFLEKQGLTPAERDHWIELMAEKENVRLDLQDAMRERGVAGGSKEIEALRSKLTDSLWEQMKEMLGEEGFAAFSDYEQISGSIVYLSPLNPKFSAANAPLSPEQSDRLLRVIIANNHPRRKNPTDLGMISHIDWSAVEQQANRVLNPTQQSILSDFVQAKSVSD